MNDLAANSAGIEQGDGFFLPNFCDVRLVFAVVIMAELLAFVLVLVTPSLLDDRWSDLGVISLFLQWIALTSAALLCLARPLLSRLGNTAAVLISYLLVLLITALLSETAFWLMVRSTILPSIDSEQNGVFLLRCLGVSAVITAVTLRYLYVQHQWRQQLQAEARARVAALQARIRPHFLFNSMNTIAALTRSDPDTAEEAIHDLSDLFRAALDTVDEHATLDAELTLARRYLNIEALRLGERLAVEWDTAALPPDVNVPPLILQPLLENAIYHGIEPLAEGGTIHIRGELTNGWIAIRVSNPVAGRTTGGHNQGNRIAQENIRQRLQLAFGKRAGLETRQQDGHYQVTIRFPGEQAS
ncbi:MAG: sensor histidine kinase [Gammaproteobacteria bacterium]|nr:sensor histidine kinase [Gammaproteobacteria bacterium]MDH3559733.1 sensor histidine kinase [Gammaproteobacteria bacterium]